MIKNLSYAKIRDIFRDRISSSETPKFEIDYSLPSGDWYVVVKSDCTMGETLMGIHSHGWLHKDYEDVLDFDPWKEAHQY